MEESPTPSRVADRTSHTRHCARPFFSLGALEEWIAAGALTLVGCEARMSTGDRYRLVEAARISCQVGGSADAHELVGEIKSLAHLRELGAELLGSSMIIGDHAYEVEHGFIGIPMDSGEIQANRARSPRERPTCRADIEELARFLLSHM